MGTNEAGTYYIGNHRSKWQPIAPAETLSTLATLPIIDPPLTTYVLSAPWTQQHEVQLWINNPFTSTIPVTVTQSLPTGITLLNTGGAAQNGNTLTWNTVVNASALKPITFTFRYPATPGTKNTLPPATLSLVNPLDGQPLSDNSNAAIFRAVWPLTLDYATPGYVLPGSSSQATITVTNWLSDTAIDGAFTISLTDAQSNIIHTESKSFNVAASGVGSLNFALPGLPRGYYQVHGQVSARGATAEAFADFLQSGLPGPFIDYRVSPIGVTHPGNILTYKVRFINNIGVPLNSAVITASLPASVTVIAESMTGGGVIEAGQVRWTLNTIPINQPVEQSFVVRVNDDAVPSGNEPGRLLSESLLTANEIMPTWGPLTWNLVTGSVTNKKIYLPVVLKNR